MKRTGEPAQPNETSSRRWPQLVSHWWDRWAQTHASRCKWYFNAWIHSTSNSSFDTSYNCLHDTQCKAKCNCFFNEDPTPAETAAKQPTLHDKITETKCQQHKSAIKNLALRLLSNISNLYFPCRSWRMRSGLQCLPCVLRRALWAGCCLHAWHSQAARLPQKIQSAGLTTLVWNKVRSRPRFETLQLTEMSHVESLLDKHSVWQKQHPTSHPSLPPRGSDARHISNKLKLVHGFVGVKCCKIILTRHVIGKWNGSSCFNVLWGILGQCSYGAMVRPCPIFK